MRKLFGLSVALAIFLLCSAFVNYSDLNQVQMEQTVSPQNSEASYYVNLLGDRVELSNTDLHGCCYLVRETSGGRTCQKINF